MTGLKSGSGDDLWAEDGDEDEADEEEFEAETVPRDRPMDNDESDASGADEADDAADDRSGSGRDGGSTTKDADEEHAADGSTGETSGSTTTDQPYIVRRAIQDKSVQFERDERLTFFVHDDVAEGERDLQQEVETALGRDVPKFDIREAVYRAALANREDVLGELVEMGYSTEE